MAESTVKVALIGDSSSLERALRRSQDAADAAERRFSSLKSGVAKLGAALAGAFAVREVGSFLFDAAKGAAEDQQAQAKLAKQLETSTGATKKQIAAVEAQISKWQFATGVLDDQLRPAYASLIVATKDTAKADKLMATALDIAAAKGLDLESVTQAIAKAQMGNVGALARLGVATKNAAGETLSFDQIMQNAAQTFGGAAATAANTTAGRMAIMKARFEELKEQIGTALLPALVKLTEWISTKLIPALSMAVEWVQQNWPQIRDTIVTAAQDVWRYVEPIVEALQALWRTFGDNILNFVRQTWPAVQQTIKGVLDVIVGIVKVFTAILQGDWGAAWEGVKQIVNGAVSAVIGTFRQLFADAQLVLGTGVEILGGFFRKLLDVIKAALSGLVDIIVAPFKAAFAEIMRLWNAGPGKVIGIAKGVGGAIGGVVGKLNPFAKGGVVPGPLGVPQLVLAHGGEEISTPGSKGSSSSDDGEVVRLLRHIAANALFVRDMSVAQQLDMRGYA